jgi:hypothetical protein
MLSVGLCYRIHKDRAGLSKKGIEKIVYCYQNYAKGRLMLSFFNEFVHKCQILVIN